MSELDDVKARAETARGAINAAAASVDTAREEAQEKAEKAAALGVEGVATTLYAAHGRLEAVAAGLGTAHGAAESAVGALAGITTELSTNDILERLGDTIDALGDVESALGSVAGDADEAHHLAGEAEIESLINLTGTAVNDLADARQTVEQSKTAAEQYRQMVEDLHQGN